MGKYNQKEVLKYHKQLTAEQVENIKTDEKNHTTSSEQLKYPKSKVEG